MMKKRKKWKKNENESNTKDIEEEKNNLSSKYKK